MARFRPVLPLVLGVLGLVVISGDAFAFGGSNRAVETALVLASAPGDTDASAGKAERGRRWWCRTCRRWHRRRCPRAHAVPELDAGSAGGAAILVVGGMILLAASRRRRLAPKATS